MRPFYVFIDRDKVEVIITHAEKNEANIQPSLPNKLDSTTEKSTKRNVKLKTYYYESSKVESGSENSDHLVLWVILPGHIAHFA